MRNSATSKVIGERTIQFRSHDGCIITLQGVHHVPESRYNLISLGALHGERFNFSSKVILWKFSKCSCEISGQTYQQCLYVVKFEGYSWWIAVILGFKIRSCGTIEDYGISSSDVQFYLERKLGQSGEGAQHRSPDRYSYGGVNSHKSCVDQGDH